MTQSGNMSTDQLLRRLRAQVNLRLPEPLSDAEWDDLVGYASLASVIGGQTNEVVERLAGVIQRRRNIYGQRDEEIVAGEPILMVTTDPAYEPDDKLRQLVLSALTAGEAANQRSVQDWRQRYLDSRLLRWQDVEEWLIAAAREDGPPTWYLANAAVPSKEGTDNEPDVEKFDLFGVLFQNRLLEYATPADGRIKRLATAAGGKLGELQRLSEDLSITYPWHLAQATIFVLTGIAPAIPAASESVEYRQLQSLSRIQLNIDPALSPHEVGEYYRQVRQRVLGSRHRELDRKNYLLALAAMRKKTDQDWHGVMQSWNSVYPDWAYTDVGKFSRDCIAARQRILRPAQT